VNRRGHGTLRGSAEAAVERRPFWPRFTELSDLVQVLAKPVSQEADFATAHQCALWASLGYPEHLLTTMPAAP